MRNSVRATYDSRETGPRYHLTTQVNGRFIDVDKPLQDPFVTTRVTVGWRDLLRSLLHLEFTVVVSAGGDIEVVNDVLELDDDTLIAGRTRHAAFHSHLAEAMGRTA
jgi:hypothetical protein